MAPATDEIIDVAAFRYFNPFLPFVFDKEDAHGI